MSDLQNEIRKAYNDVVDGFACINAQINYTLEEIRYDVVLRENISKIQARLSKLSRSMADITL